MDESNEKCNWKKVFKKFLEPQNPVENNNITRNNFEESVSAGSPLDEEKKIFEYSLIFCSPASNDSGYGWKLESNYKSPSKSHNTYEPNQNFPQAGNCEPEFRHELHLNSPPTHELNMNIPKTSGYKSEFYDKFSSKELSPREFNMNIPEASGCKPQYNHKLTSEMLTHDLNVDIPQIKSVLERNKIEEIQCDSVPEWKKAFKNILGDNNSSVMDVPCQKDINQPKEIGNFKNSDTPGITSQKKQSSYKPKRRFERAERYKNYEVSEAEKKVKEIFALSRMFKFEQVNMNDFHGCGVDIFKQDWSSSSKSTKGCLKVTDKPYLPLTGFIAKTKPYTTTDVAVSNVPFDEDPWDDDLLI